MQNDRSATQAEKLLWEKELLGLYISGHPLDRLREKLEKREVNIKKIKEEIKLGTACQSLSPASLKLSRQVVTKNNERMAFLKNLRLDRFHRSCLFSVYFCELRLETLVPEKCIALSGKVSQPKQRKKHHH